MLRHLFQYSEMASLFIFQNFYFNLLRVDHVDIRVDHAGLPRAERWGRRYGDNNPSSDFPKTEQSLGDDCAGDTPLPIPNRVVKPRCADGTASELVWQSR